MIQQMNVIFSAQEDTAKHTKREGTKEQSKPDHMTFWDNSHGLACCLNVMNNTSFRSQRVLLWMASLPIYNPRPCSIGVKFPPPSINTILFPVHLFNGTFY